MRRPRPEVGLLALVVVTITALDLLWFSKEQRPPHWDMANHLGNSLIFLHLLATGHLKAFLTAYTYYPPFVYWVTAVFYVLLDREAEWVAVLSNVVFLALLVFSTYGLGVRLWSRRVGVLAAVFVVTTPMMVTAFKEYMLDAPLTALVTLALYLLVRCDRFAHRGSSIALGLACGCGVLAKWTFPVPVALPLLVTAGAAAASSECRARRLVNIAWTLLVALLVAVPWYASDGVQWQHDRVQNADAWARTHGLPAVASFRSATWYVLALPRTQLFLLPCLFLAAGLVTACLRRESARRNLVPLLTIASSYAGFTLILDKDDRFTDVMLPAAAIVAVSWLELVQPRLRAWLAGVLVVYGAVAFLAISFGTSLLPRNLNAGSVTIFAQRGYIIGPPTRENWHEEDLFRTIAAAPRSRRRFSYHGPDTIWFNKLALRYFSLRYDATGVGTPAAADFAIVRGRPISLPPAFVEVLRYRLPDGEPLRLYRRT